MRRELAERLGFDPDDPKVKNQWTDEESMSYALRVSEFLTRSQEIFPARDELLPIPKEIPIGNPKWKNTPLQPKIERLAELDK